MNNYNSNSNIESNSNNNKNNNINNSYLNNTPKDLHSLHHKNSNSIEITRDNDVDVESIDHHEEEDEDDDEAIELDDDHSPRGHNIIHQQFQQQQIQHQRQHQQQQQQQQTHTSPNNSSIHHSSNHQHLDHSENIRLRKSSFDYNDYNQTNLTTTQSRLSNSLSNSQTSLNLLNTSRNQNNKPYGNNNNNNNNDNNNTGNQDNIGIQNSSQKNIQFINQVNSYTTNSHHTLNPQKQQQQHHNVNTENSVSNISRQHILHSNNSISMPLHQQHSQNQFSMNNMNNTQPDSFPILYRSSTHSPAHQIIDTQLTHSSTPDSPYTAPHDENQNQHQQHHQNQQQQQQHQQQQHQQQQQQQQQTKTQNKVTRARRTNKPGAKFGAKKKSWVWNWFIQDQSDTNKATCKKCNKLIIRLPNDKSSPKKLIEHLKIHKITRSTINHTSISNNITMINDDSVTELSENELDIKGSLHQTVENKTIVNNHGKIVKSKRNLDNSVTRNNTKKSKISGIENDNNNNTKDNDNYSSLKFQRDIITFLTENKLPIKTIKSKSFRKLILTLKPSAVKDLDDLDNFYCSFIEIFNYSKENGDIHDENKDSEYEDEKEEGEEEGKDKEEEQEEEEAAEEEEAESDASTIDYEDKIEGNIYKSADDDEKLRYNE
ncbi:hypothetical protein B5S31_g3272 [[Candida] boidinii]|nr:hypothetical protein B5S31_g3272 [[Candida] boidinii]